MKFPITPDSFKPGDFLEMKTPRHNLMDMLAEKVEAGKKAKNEILLAAFARRTGNPGTPEQVKESMSRFKRIVSPESELVLLDGVPLVEFKHPRIERKEPGLHECETYVMDFKYKDFTVL